MSLPSFATQTITVQRAPMVDDHGTDVPDWTDPDEHDETGCSVQPAPGTEDLIGRDQITTIWTVYAPLAADVLTTDRVVYQGDTFEVDGPIRRWETGVLDHVEFGLKAADG